MFSLRKTGQVSNLITDILKTLLPYPCYLVNSLMLMCRVEGYKWEYLCVT